MANQYVNKVVVNGTTKLDLTGDTATAEKVLAGFTFHDKSGAPVTGTSSFNADTSGTTASAEEVLAGEKFIGPTGQEVTGTMPNRGAAGGTISTKAQQVEIQQGYHDGSGSVSIVSTEQAKIIPGNIKAGVILLGVTGTHSGSEDIQAQAKSATPTFSQQTILPDSGYDYLTQVTVAAIPVTETDNPQGGKTLTVG